MLRRQRLRPRRGADAKTTPVAAIAALALLAAALRTLFARHAGVPPPPLALAAGIVTVVTVAALASRAAGPLAGAAAALIFAALPAAVVAGVAAPRETYALCAAAFSLLFYREGNGRAAERLAAGAFAGATVALSTSALLLPAYYALTGLRRLLRGERRRGASFSWLAAFAAFLGAAFAVEYSRAGNLAATFPHAIATAPPIYEDTKLLLRRLFADAAAMLFWDARAFGATVVLALAATALFLRRRHASLLFYGGLLLLALAAFNFFPAKWNPYAPMALAPERWLLLALPAAVLGGGAVAELWSAAARGTLTLWAGALGGAFIAAALFVNGNVPYALTNFSLWTAAVVATFALAGVARRGGAPIARRVARLAAALVVFVSLAATVILYL